MSFVGSKLKLLWQRITFSRLTSIYFLFSLCHCIIQVTLQIQAFSTNRLAASFLYSVLLQGNASDPNSFTVLTSDGLRMCDHVPSTFDTQSCRVIWNGTDLNLGNTYATGTSSIPSSPLENLNSSVSVITASPNSSLGTYMYTQLSSESSSSSSSPTPTHGSDAITATMTTFAATSTSLPDLNGSFVEVIIDGHEIVEFYERSNNDGGVITTSSIDGQVQVQINGLGYNNKSATLDRACLWALNYPVETLLDTKREDITFIAFQFWVLGMSIVALLNESIPHILASSLTHMLATAWAGYQISHTADFKASFSRIATDGACQGFNLLPTYWAARAAAEISILALNCAALLMSLFLSWRLLKLFGWLTFKRVGASLKINRIYKLVLILSIVIQLSLFFMVVAVALWIDQLWNGSIAHLAKEALVYRVIFIVVLLLMVPWLTTGWFAVRRELRIPMLIFISLSFGYLVGWSAMFASATFRWTFITWRFFSLIATASAFLTLIALVLGLICRLNFGKGLLRYLSAHELIPDERIPHPYMQSTEASDPEKIAFPSFAQAVPTFSAAFGSGEEVPIPSRMFPGRQLGPRFFQESAVPFESPPQLARHIRTQSDASSLESVQGPPLSRHLSRGSEDSAETFSTSGSSSRRWQID